MSSKYDLIIFDCDGTLVDTENALNFVCSTVLLEMGYSKYTEEYCNNNFMGSGWPKVIEHIQLYEDKNFDTKYFWHKARVAALDTIEKSVRSIPGASELLTALNKKMMQIAVASNGEKQNVIQSLRGANLYNFFQPENIFNYEDSDGIAKPSPDLFLYVAKKFNVPANKCLVLEDSDIGVSAAKSAKMDVIVINPYQHNPRILKIMDLIPTAIITNLTQVLDHL